MTLVHRKSSNMAPNIILLKDGVVLLDERDYYGLQNGIYVAVSSQTAFDNDQRTTSTSWHVTFHHTVAGIKFTTTVRPSKYMLSTIWAVECKPVNENNTASSLHLTFGRCFRSYCSLTSHRRQPNGNRTRLDAVGTRTSEHRIKTFAWFTDAWNLICNFCAGLKRFLKCCSLMSRSKRDVVTIVRPILLRSNVVPVRLIRRYMVFLWSSCHMAPRNSWQQQMLFRFRPPSGSLSLTPPNP